MEQIYFIFIITILLILFIFNNDFEKKHNNKSFLEEKKVKKTIKNLSFIDEIYRLFIDTSIITF